MLAKLQLPLLLDMLLSLLSLLLQREGMNLHLFLYLLVVNLPLPLVVLSQQGQIVKGKQPPLDLSPCLELDMPLRAMAIKRAR